MQKCNSCDENVIENPVNIFLGSFFYTENLVIRSEPFPEGIATSSPSITSSEEKVSEAKTTLFTDTADSTAGAKESVTNKASPGVKKSSAEKKANQDGDDPFGALDWKDGIASLPGNVIKESLHNCRVGWLRLFLIYTNIYFNYSHPRGNSNNYSTSVHWIRGCKKNKSCAVPSCFWSPHTQKARVE